jgi:hypothetical protein
MNGAAIPYPIQTQSQACHQFNPNWMEEETIIHLEYTQQFNVAFSQRDTNVRVHVETVSNPTLGLMVSALK